ncbi:stachyose synthase [Canna indica]|uniref:Stachyose synthase n=1 Tax=Canna indica TaxID=4628 RepID=A0AAQ3KBP3_9LILI|nr:stachyose synthase [Canna indica]
MASALRSVGRSEARKHASGFKVGLTGTKDDLAVDKIVEGGISLVRPDQAAHSYLSKAGVSGVKVDVIHGFDLAKPYYDGLSKSVVKNFKGIGIISSMQQCNDFFFFQGSYQACNNAMTSSSLALGKCQWEEHVRNLN